MKKILITMLSISLLVFIGSSVSNASEAEYHSDASTTFYGKYVEKDSEKPDDQLKKPNNHNTGGTHGWKGGSSSNGGNSTKRPNSSYRSNRVGSSSGNSTKIIPRTGNTNQSISLFLGLTSLLASVLIMGKNIILKK